MRPGISIRGCVRVFVTLFSERPPGSCIMCRVSKLVCYLSLYYSLILKQWSELDLEWPQPEVNNDVYNTIATDLGA